MAMEFWGVEVKGGDPLVVGSGDGFVVHLSQACLGDAKKDKENDAVYLYVKINDKKYVIGTLSSAKFPQLQFDLVFEKDFELSHSWKNGSVYLSGYKVPMESSEDGSESDSDQEAPVAANNVVARPVIQHIESAAKANVVKLNSTEGKQKVKIVEPNKDDDSDKETDDSSDEDEEESSDDQVMIPSPNGKNEVASNDEEDESDDDEDSVSDDEEDDESDSEDDESGDEERDTQKMGEKGKKRAAAFASKSPVSAKKAKLVTPQKTDGKKWTGYTGTPHPSKQIAKTSASSDKGQNQKGVICKSCNRSFGSDNALQSHTKAKHSAA